MRLWRGFRRPVRRDRAFWLAIGVSVLAVAAETALAATVVDVNPIASVVVALLVFVVVFSIAGAIVGAVRGFGEGWRDRTPSASTPEPDPEPPTTGSRTMPSLEQLTESAKAQAAKVRKPTSADVDKGARTLGRAIGAAKRAVQSPPDD